MQAFLFRMILTLLLIFVVPFLYATAYAGDVTLAWDPKTGSDVTGYKVYYGTSSRNYSTSVNVGRSTTCTLAGLASGTYYFAVTAHYASGAETTPSNEVSKTISAPSLGGGSLVHSGTMTANSQNFSADHSVNHLWDGCTEGTAACTTGAGNISSFWVEFDLGRDYDLTFARLFGDAEGAWISTSWALKHKRNSGDPWSTAFSGADATVSGWSVRALSVQARYLRVEVFGSTTNPATQARELEIFGSVATGSISRLPAPVNVSVRY
jgi:hypothetical protein